MNHKSKFFEQSLEHQMGIRRYMGIVSTSSIFDFGSTLLRGESDTPQMLLLFALLGNIFFVYSVIEINKAPNWFFKFITLSAYLIVIFGLPDLIWKLFYAESNYFNLIFSTVPVLTLVFYIKDILNYRSLVKNLNSPKL